MLLERKERVLTREEVRAELERLQALNQKKVLKTVAVATGGMAIFRFCQLYSASIDGVASNIGSIMAEKGSSFVAKMAKPVIFPYVITLPMWGLYLSGITLVVLMVVMVVVKNRANGEDVKTTVKDSLFILAPVILWGIMEVLF